MRKLVWLLAVMALDAMANEFELEGQMTQGSLLRGKAPVGSEIRLNGEAVALSPQGYFAFGFGRDATLDHVLDLVLPNGDKQSIAIALSKREYDVQNIEGLPPKMVTPPQEVLERIREDNRKVGIARQRFEANTDFMQDFIWPAEGRISGVYGSQRVLNGEPKRPHFGVDVAGPVGTEVIAPADGLVTLWEPDMYYSGGTMIIDHGMGVSSTFLHMSGSVVEVGDVVKQGQPVGAMGKTGRATGSHLDWRINWFGTRLDPELLVPPRR